MRSIQRDDEARYQRARSLIGRADRGAPTEVLDEAITELRALVDATNAAPRIWIDLGVALALRHDRQGDPTDLRSAIGANRHALDGIDHDVTARARVLSNLGMDLTRLFETTGEVAAIEEATAVLRVAAASRRKDDPDRALTYSNLGLALTRWMEHHHDLGPSDEATSALRTAIDLVRVRPATMAQMMCNLGNVLMLSSHETGDEARLREAVSAFRASVAAVPAGHPALPGCYAELSGALVELSIADADRQSLLDAIGLLAKALRHVPHDDADRPIYLNKRAVALRSSFARQGDIGSLEDAMVCWREAIALTPAGHPSGLAYRSNLALALRNRFEYSGDVSALDEAVDLLRDVVAETPIHLPDRANYQADLANALHRVGIRSADTVPLAEAVTLLREAVVAQPPTHPYHLLHLTNLGAVLFTLAQVGRDVHQLDAAIDVLRAAGDLGESVNVGPGMLLNLGDAYRTRFGWTGDRTDMEMAAAAYRSLIDAVDEPARMRTEGARRLGDMLSRSGDMPGALDGYVAAVRLLSLVAWLGLQRDDQERLLSEFGGLASRAAACAIELGELDRAVELLEQGRGVLYGQLQDLRMDLAAARRQMPEQADRLAAVHQLLEASTDAEPGGLDRFARQRLAAERDSLLDTIRQRPDLAGFLTPPDVPALRAALGHRTVVIVNVAPRRSDALIVSSTGITALPLPDLTGSDATTYAAAILGIPHEHTGRLDTALTGTLTWLWDTVVEPVTALLRAAAGSATPEPLWWMPTGPLSFLPIHAAGRYGPPDNDDRNALAWWTSSYTPTLRSLGQVPADTTAVPAAPLVVAVPDAEGTWPLPGAVREAERVGRHLGPAAVTRTRGDATIREVTRLLEEATWGHFACHAVTNPDHPSDSHLLLADGPLPIRQIAAHRGDRITGRPALAYLSVGSYFGSIIVARTEAGITAEPAIEGLVCVTCGYATSAMAGKRSRPTIPSASTS